MLLIVGGDSLTYVTGHRIVTDVMIDAYETAYSLPIFFAVILVIAPALEELFFRGFLFQGIRFSCLGAVTAVVLSALLWAVMHVQYDAFGVGTIFAGGLLIGLARLKTNSIYVPLALHALNNLISTIQLLIYVHLLR